MIQSNTHRLAVNLVWSRAFTLPPSLPTSFLSPFLPLLLAWDTNLIKKLTDLEELMVGKNFKLLVTQVTSHRSP